MNTATMTMAINHCETRIAVDVSMSKSFVLVDDFFTLSKNTFLSMLPEKVLNYHFLNIGMRYNEILNELRVGLHTGNQILNNEDIRMGFEVEMIPERAVDDWDAGELKDENGYADAYSQDYDSPPDRDTIDLNDCDWDQLQMYLLDTNIDKAEETYKIEAEKQFKQSRGRANDLEEFMENEFTMDDYVKDEYGGSYHHFMLNNDLVPAYGWDEYGENIYTDSLFGSLERSIERALKVEFNSTSTDVNVWKIVKDASLSSKMGAEVVSPPLPLKDALDYLQRLFKWMERSYTTDKSTGLHINLSLKGKTIKDYDFLKMVVMFEEKNVAELFNRFGAEYAKPIKDILPNIVGRIGGANDDINFISKNVDANKGQKRSSIKNILFMLKRIGSNIKPLLTKYFTINNRGNGVFEFRVMGGENYHQKFAIVKKKTLDMANVLLASSDDDLYQKEYIKKVLSMMSIDNFKIEKPKELSAFEFQVTTNGINDLLDLAKTNKSEIRDSGFVFTVASALHILTSEIARSPSPLKNAQLKYFIKTLGLDKTYFDQNRETLSNAFVKMPVIDKIMGWRT